MKKKSVLFLLILFFSADYLFSAYGGNFLKIPVAPVPSALSDSYSARVSADSLLYNPAGPGLLTYSELSLAHNQYFEGIMQEYLTSTVNTEYGNFSILYSVLSSGDIDRYDENENKIGKVSTSHKAYGIGYSKGFPYFEYARGKIDPMLITPSWSKIKPVKVYIPKVYRFSFGFLAKKIEERLDREKSSTIAFDAGALLVLPGHLHIGTSIQNISGKQKFYLEENKFPLIYRFGVAKDFHTVRDIMNFIFSVDFVNDEENGKYFNFGFENDILKSFQLRLGYSTKDREGSKLTVGFGMTFDRLLSQESLFQGFRMDYALVNYGVIGVTHRIGLQFIW